MYRNVVYTTEFDQNGKPYGCITLFTWDEHGNRVTIKEAHQSHLYIESDDGNEVSMFGTPVERRDFPNSSDKFRFVENNVGRRLFENFTPVREYLFDRYNGMQESSKFAQHPLRVMFIDIEVAIEDESVNELLALVNQPINVMTVYDSLDERYYCWILLNPKWFNDPNAFVSTSEVEYRVFTDERAMYNNFLGWYSRTIPDVITGWNIDRFDIPYIVNRMDKVVGEDATALLSPVGKIRKKLMQKRINNVANEVEVFDIIGISVIDYIFLYRDKFLKKQESYALDFVGKEELGMGKVEYDGSFKEFYKNDFKLFVEYNVHDVRIVVELDRKLKFMNLMRKLCNIGLCEYMGIYKSGPYIYGALAAETRSRGKIIYSGIAGTNVEDINSHYEGGFVFEPKTGLYRNGVFTLDLNSLYPNVMIALNISPETKIGKLTDLQNGTWALKQVNGKAIMITQTELDDMLANKATLSSNNVLYVKPEIAQGIIPSFLSRIYSERASTKKEMLRIEKLLKENPDQFSEEETRTMETQIDNLDSNQHAVKILLNSIYGQIGSKFFALFDVDNAEAVTLSGQTVIKTSAQFITGFVSKIAKWENSQDIVIAGDTDSLMVDGSGIIENLMKGVPYQERWNKENSDKICAYLDDVLTPAVNVCCARIIKEKFHSSMRNIKFKREVLGSQGLFVAKKRYIIHVINKEGTYEPYWKCTGVELKKNELPSTIKKDLGYIIFTAMEEGWDSAKFQAEIRKTWEKFVQETEPNTLAYLKNYTTGKNSIGFLMSEKGAGVHARASNYHNDILAAESLLSKYDKITPGDSIRYIYIKPNNSYGIDAIAWKGRWPKEFSDIFEIDYYTMFEKVMLNPLKKIIEIFKWRPFDPNIDSEVDILTL